MRIVTLGRPLRVLATAILCLATTVTVAPAQQPESASTLIRPERVFDAATGEVRTGWVVLVAGERIESVGPVGSVQAPDDVRILDLPGATLLPGLIDAHSHLFLHPYDETLWDDQVLKEARAYRTLMAGVNAERTLMSGFTLLRDLGSEGAGWADLAVRDAIADGLIPGPRVLTATLAIAATASYAPGPRGWDPDLALPQGAQMVTGDTEIRRAVREQAGHGADVIKVYADFRRAHGTAPTFTLGELEALVDEATRRRPSRFGARQFARGDAPRDAGRRPDDRARIGGNGGGVSPHGREGGRLLSHPGRRRGVRRVLQRTGKRLGIEHTGRRTEPSHPGLAAGGPCCPTGWRGRRPRQ